MSLNGGLPKNINNSVSPSDQALIDDFLKNHGVEKCQPAGVTGNEASRATKEIIATRRREYRKMNK